MRDKTDDENQKGRILFTWGLVQILSKKINCLILKVKYITNKSPDSLTREYHAHKRVFGDLFLINNNSIYVLNTLN